jgi:DNA-cytosine methyltransferase
MAKKLRHGSLFTGVGGMDLGLDWAGFETVWQVEIDPFARKVLKKHWSSVPKFTDVRECGRHNLQPVDIITGGYPCQDHSIAGKKRGLGTADSPTERSGLWFEYLRIVRDLRPRWVLIENVSRLLHTADGDTVLSGMEEIGYSWWPRLLDAGALGAPHKRERAWIICRRNDAHEHCDIEAVMVEQWALPPGCRREMEEARERWEDWRHELSGGTGHGCSPRITTPTATEILEAEWPNDGRFYQTASGRWRKRSKVGTDSSMSWAQEMAVRAVVQENPRLTPTPESCEEFMGFPRGWTDLGGELMGCPRGWTDLGGGESDAEIYAKIVRGVHGIPNWEDRLRALGNAGVPQMPMRIGAYVQQYESRLSLAAHAGIREFKEDNLSENLCAQDIPSPQLATALSPVEARYESLGVEGTKKAYQELNAALDGLTSTVVSTMKQIARYLARMQSLLSQRGADRKTVLRKAGLPAWTQWAEGYAKSLGCAVRTIQRHIRQHREGQTHGASDQAAATKKRVNGGGSKPTRLDGRQQAALVKAQLVTNDLVVALKGGADWHSVLVEYEKVAITPTKLATYLDALSPEPDWKTVLTKLVNALEPCGDRLPVPAKDALNAAKGLLGGKGKTEMVCLRSASPKLTAWPPARNPERGGAGTSCQVLISLVAYENRRKRLSVSLR